mmetsp:Transcript_30142/g.57887  ORF Transcript_30142/g.57887 Transcript_30142/m.57887 type:complete len:303 (-) Transcript_30142:159-1067(-)
MALAVTNVTVQPHRVQVSSLRASAVRLTKLAKEKVPGIRCDIARQTSSRLVKKNTGEIKQKVVTTRGTNLRAPSSFLGHVMENIMTAFEDPDKPIRVLCLHGKYENAGSFCFSTAFLDEHEGEPGEREISWEYINGAILALPPDQYEWWTLPPGERSFTAKTYEGADKSLELIETIWADSGPFDGIMGFSQGAMLAGVVAANSLLNSDYKAKPKFAILFGAAFPLPFAPLLKELEASGRTIPTLHVLGKEDSTNPSELGQKLAGCFADSQVEWHQGAHFVPSDPEIVATCHKFCIKHSNVVE